MISWDAHGGGCCGIRHIFGFNNRTNSKWQDGRYVQGRKKTEAQMRKEIQNAVENCIDDQGSECNCDDYDCDGDCGEKKLMIECVLVEDQWKQWEPALFEEGFKEVFRFKNSNSGNICRVYVKGVGQDNEVLG